jgi:hypothetical protein
MNRFVVVLKTRLRIAKPGQKLWRSSIDDQQTQLSMW